MSPLRGTPPGRSEDDAIASGQLPPHVLQAITDRVSALELDPLTGRVSLRPVELSAMLHQVALAAFYARSAKGSSPQPLHG